MLVPVKIENEAKEVDDDEEGWVDELDEMNDSDREKLLGEIQPVRLQAVKDPSLSRLPSSGKRCVP